MRFTPLVVIIVSMILGATSVFAETKKMIYQDSLIFQLIQYQFVLDHETVKKASLISRPDGSFVGLQVELKPEVVGQFDKMTTEGKGKRMNIVLNNRIVSTSVIQSGLGSNFLISGVSKEEATKFVDAIWLYERK